MTTPLALPAPRRTVTPSISPKLLGNIERFFGSRTATIRELLQNSARAGATHVHATYDAETRTLTLTDNGRGLHDPAVLLRVAESGWTPHEATDPAGMGALSALAREHTHHVTYASQDWKITLTADDFATASDIPVQSRPHEGGFEVQLNLRRDTDAHALLTTAREFFPFTLTLNGEEIPHAPLTGRYELNTPYGRVLLAGPRRGHVIWEGQLVGADRLKSLLNLTPAASVLVYELGLMLVADSGSGLRPKLPDRGNLIENAALQGCAHAISEAVNALVASWAAQVAPAQGDEVASHTELVRRLHAVPGFGYHPGILLDAVISEAGWRRVLTGAPGDVRVRLTAEDYGLDVVWPDPFPSVWSYRAQASVTTAPDWLGSLLRGVLPGGEVLGAGEDWDADPAFVVQGQTLLTSRAGFSLPFRLALAERVTWRGVDVPVGITVPDGDEERPVVVLAGSAEQAERTLRERAGQIGDALLLLCGALEEWSEFHDWSDDAEWSGAELGQELRARLLELCFPERDAARREAEGLESRARAHRQFAKQLSQALSWVELGDADRAAVTRLTERLEGRASALEERVPELREKYGL